MIFFSFVTAHEGPELTKPMLGPKRGWEVFLVVEDMVESVAVLPSLPPPKVELPGVILITKAEFSPC